MGSQAYNSQHVKQVKLALNLKTDTDIIRYLATIPNMQGYIKALIRNDMMKGEQTMKYEIDLTVNGTTSPIDTVTAPDGYTADDYIRGCRENADQEWVDMIESGEITVTPIED